MSEANTRNSRVNEPKPPEGENPPQATKKQRVRVILGEGTLGHLGLKGGETTDHEDYVALLKTRRGKSLVQEI